MNQEKNVKNMELGFVEYHQNISFSSPERLDMEFWGEVRRVDVLDVKRLEDKGFNVLNPVETDFIVQLHLEGVQPEEMSEVVKEKKELLLKILG